MSREQDPLTGYTVQKHLALDFLELTCDPTALHLMVIDIDRMSHINYALGHVEGDRLMVEAASIMKSTAKDHYDVYRTGGDEFAFLFVHMTTVKVIQIGKNIRKAIKAHFPTPIQRDLLPINTKATDFFFSISFGIASYPTDGQDLQSLTECAWKRLYTQRYDDKEGESSSY